MRARTLHLATILVALIPGCRDRAGDDPADDPNGGGKADDVDPADFACKNTSGATPEEIASFRDPIAEFLIKRGDTCPSNMGEMVDKLREIDPDGCVPGQDLRTRIVSDDARMTDSPTNYRTVTTRACGSGDEKDLFWTLLGLSDTEDVRQRTGTEMMAFDPSTGLYNYYLHNGSGGFSFEGNSVDIVNGAGCGCHGGGGVLMKELDRPWPHFASAFGELPGTQRFFDNANREPENSMFGIEGEGAELERVIREGNVATVAGRIAHHRVPEKGNVRQLLEPLFCPKQMNLDAGGEGPGAPMERIPGDFFVDPHFDIQGVGIAMDDAVYEAAIAEAGQRVDGVPGVNPAPTDKAFKFVYPERSGIDIDYVQRLLADGIIDQDFATDVLSIDFTRPLYSDERCNLLAFAPAYGPMASDGGDDPGGDESGGGDTGGMETGGGMDTGGMDTGGSDTGGMETGGSDMGGEPGDPGDCCEGKTEGGGCSNEMIEACVCANDSFCCDNTFDDLCAESVETQGCFDCNGDGMTGTPVPGPQPTEPDDSLTIAEATPDAIRDAFIKALVAAAPEPGTAAATLLSNLQDPDDEDRHRERVAAFLSACQDRPQADMMRDALRTAHGIRERTRGFIGVIEHSEQMPTADLPSGLVTLDPATCSLPE